ncbi:hypothetical protein BJ508DRAFT_419910 [Ascobolus immersus RN42]|uniref:F-box domain-containing protein n=1 Tax=Ascobolus immersus RN42 TaxID=1160509 RepID=A0A3N4HEY2_ASCIM|nr:hypothetical protein BJ508DRAFT_419910 [Ascobolus immersus RN42]
MPKEIRTKAPKAQPQQNPRRSARSRPVKAPNSTASTTTVVSPAKRKPSRQPVTRKRKVPNPEQEAEESDSTSHVSDPKRKKLDSEAGSITSVSTSAKEPTNVPRTTILSLPAELVQNICLNLPYARDAIAVHLSCQALSRCLDNFFWFKRQGEYRQIKNSYYYGPSKNDYYATEDYLDDALRCYYGWTGGYLGDGTVHEVKGRKPKGKAAPVKTTRNKKTGALALTDRQKKWKALSIGEALDRKPNICQICCQSEAKRYYSSFRVSLCYVCIGDLAIPMSEVKFLTKVSLRQGVRIQPYLKGLEPEYVWLADLDERVIKVYGKSVKEMVMERRNGKAQRDRDIYEYKERQKRLFIEYGLEQWAKPEYDEFREVVTDEQVKKWLEATTRDYRFIESGVIRSLVDKPESWLEEKLRMSFWFLQQDSAPEWKAMYPSEYNRQFESVEQFHMERLARDFDAGMLVSDPDVRRPDPIYSTLFTSSDGMALVGVCRICYENMKERLVGYKSQIQARERESAWVVESEETLEYMEDFRDRCRYGDRYTGSGGWPTPWGYVKYKFHSALGLIQHYTAYHPLELLSKQRNYDGEWFRFMEGVEGAEPKREWSLEENSINRRIPLPGGPFVNKVFRPEELRQCGLLCQGREGRDVTDTCLLHVEYRAESGARYYVDRSESGAL